MANIKYPKQLDDNSSLPISTDNVTKVSASVVNNLRSAVLAIQSELGTEPSSTFGNVKGRLDALQSQVEPLQSQIDNLVTTGGAGTNGTDGVGLILPVDAVATTNVTQASTINAVDGVTLIAGVSRILCIGQTDTTQNGVKLVHSGAWTNPADFNSNAQVIPGQTVKVLSGTLGAGTVWGLESGNTINGAKTYKKVPNADDKTNLDKIVPAVINIAPPQYTGTPSLDTAGMTTVTAQINAALAQAVAKTGVTVRLAAGYDYYVNGDLYCDLTQGVRIEGGGGATNPAGTRIIRVGTSAVATGFATFTQPAVNSTVIVTVGSTSGFVVATGTQDVIYRCGDAEGSPNFYKCTAIGSGVVTLKNIGATTNATAGATITADFIRSTDAIIHMRSTLGCKVDKLALISSDMGFAGTAIDYDGSPFAQDGSLNKVLDSSIYGGYAFVLATLISTGVSAPAITLSGTCELAFNLLIIIKAGGARGTATFAVSTNGGKTWVADSNNTPITTAATYTFPSTSVAFGLVLNFPTGTYATTHRYSARQGMQNAVRLPNTFNCTIDTVHFAQMLNGVFASSVRHSITQISVTQWLTGFTVVGKFCSGLHVDITPEPGGRGYGAGGVWDEGSDSSRITVHSGDILSGGSWVYLSGCRDPHVDGVLQVQTGTGAAPVTSYGNTGLVLRGKYLGDYAVDCSDTSVSPTHGIDAQNVEGFTWNLTSRSGTLIKGTNFDPLGVAYSKYGSRAMASATFGEITTFAGQNLFPPQTLILSSGSNTTIHVPGYTHEIAGPSTAFVTHGFLPYGNGQYVLIRNRTAQQWTIPNESATETTAANRVLTGNGNDLILPAPTAGSYAWALLHYSGTDNRWIVTGSSLQTPTAIVSAPNYVATSNITLSGSQTVDGATPITSEIVLCVAQTNLVENGYWVVNTSGAWTRPSFYNSDVAIAALLGIGTGLVLSGITYVGSQWFLKSGATIAGAKVYKRVLPGTTLYMPPPNGTNDKLAWDALVSELTGVGGTIQFQSGHYKSPTGFRLSGVAGIHIRGVSSSVSGVPSTTFQWTGARTSRSAVFQIDTCNSCSISHVGLLSSVSGPEYACLIGGTAQDADYCHVFDCFAYGGAAAAPVATSATSVNLSTAINTTVTITLSAATVPYLIGTQLFLGSRGGSGTMWGLITASSGTSVSFIPTDVFGTGSHTDWDVLQPMNGFNIGSSELCAIYRSQTTHVYNGFHVEGVGGLVEATCSTASPLGPSFRSGNAASYVKLFGNAEFNSVYSWTTALLVDTVVNFEASIGMGDDFTGGGPCYVLKGILGGTVHGLNGQSSTVGAAVVSVDSCAGLHLRGIYGRILNGFFVLNKGSNNNCSVDGLCAGDGTMNTFSGGFAGFTSWYDIQAQRRSVDFLNAQLVQTHFGVAYTSSNFPLGNGQNDNVSLIAAVGVITGPTAPFSWSGAYPPFEGHEAQFVYLGTQTMTILHGNAGSTASYRFVCPGGQDLVLVPRSGGVVYFSLIYSSAAFSGAGGWIVNVPVQAQTTPIRVASGATDAPTYSDIGANIQYTNAAGCAITLNTMPAGTSMLVSQEAVGALTFVSGSASIKTAITSSGTTAAQNQSRFLFWVDATHVRIT